MKMGNTTLIPQNIAPDNAKSLAIYDGDTKICTVDISRMIPQNLGTKKYSVGLLSDTHTSLSLADSITDLTRAIGYFSSVADMTCICGDLCVVNENGGLEKHKEIVNANKGNMVVYAMAGNHEHISNTAVVHLSDDDMKNITGFPLFYTVSNQPTDETKRNYYNPIVGNDIFIMCGSVDYHTAFDTASFQWLQSVLHENRNKRCFLFVHAPLDDSQHCGDALNVLTWDHLGGYKTSFISLLKYYKNVIYFHGHTHAMLEMQDYLQGLDNPLPANYDFTDGIHSVHIPSLAISRDISSGERVDVVETSQGYLMDVYENHIVLKGRDFVKGGFVPIAQYCLDTTLQAIEAGTFTDDTGTITIL